MPSSRAPLVPPLAPMLARLSRTLPEGEGWWFEPKWDGFRCLAFIDGAEVDLRSRHDRPLGRDFPEVASALRSLSPARFVLDGEIVILERGGFDFAALMARIHPSSSRVRRLVEETPAVFVAFDLLSLDDRDLRGEPFAARRSRLVEVAGGVSRVRLTPATTSRDEALRWLKGAGEGVDGVVAKHESLRYEEGKRAMVKVKPLASADCIVAGVRLAGPGAVASLLLGLYDEAGKLRHVGVSSSFTGKLRRELWETVRPWVVPLEGHPWQHGFGIQPRPMGRLRGAAGVWTPDLVQDWVPLAPALVCEVAYDQLDGDRFRHPAGFVRWRPDRPAGSCGFGQLKLTATAGPPGSHQAERIQG